MNASNVLLQVRQRAQPEAGFEPLAPPFEVVAAAHRRQGGKTGLQQPPQLRPPIRTKGGASRFQQLVRHAVAVGIQQGEHLTGDHHRIARRQQCPEPAKLGAGLPEHLAQTAAAVVAALEQACGQLQETPHLRDRCVRVGRGQRTGDGLTQPVELARQRPHLVPVDEAFRALQRAQPLFHL